MLVQKEPIEKAQDYHGMAAYSDTNPTVSSDDLPALNIKMSFDEAVKLSLAIQSAVLKLNRYNRSIKAGKQMGLLLSVKTATKTITVIEAKVLE